LPRVRELKSLALFPNATQPASSIFLAFFFNPYICLITIEKNPQKS
jgi:hypothetical protein